MACSLGKTPPRFGFEPLVVSGGTERGLAISCFGPSSCIPTENQIALTGWHMHSNAHVCLFWGLFTLVVLL